MAVPAPRPLSRRSVARTAAWAAPAVTVVAAAPAYAATGDVAELHVFDAYGFWEQPTLLRFSVALENTGTGPTGPVTVTISNAEPAHPGNYQLVTNVVPSEATFTVATTSPSTLVVTVPGGVPTQEMYDISFTTSVTDPMPASGTNTGHLSSFSLSASAPDGNGGTTQEAGSFTLLSGPPIVG
ncbi:MAG: hypothetical protein ACI379_04610 [Nocardioides sp.]|uniref:hypothetical protein n=1 Tax=Nocardioides sp. TaxID=35761 RepID=UPI003F0C8623